MVGTIVKATPRLLLWALGVAAFLGVSFFAIAGGLTLLQGTEFLGNENFFFSSVCALIAWFFVAFFLFGKETIRLPITEAATFLANARRSLEDMGYEVTGYTADSLRTRRGFQLLLFGRGIRIKCVNGQATITGPKLWVDALRRRVRVQNFLDSTELSLSDVAQRGVLLKRLHIQMRVRPDQLDEVSRNVVQALAREGEVVCEVSLLAQSATGIRESTVEALVRPWLAVQGITADIQKDSVMMSDLPSASLLPRKLPRKLKVP